MVVLSRLASYSCKGLGSKSFQFCRIQVTVVSFCFKNVQILSL